MQFAAVHESAYGT